MHSIVSFGILRSFLVGLPLAFLPWQATRESRISLPAGEYKIEKLVDIATSSLGKNFVIDTFSRANLNKLVQISANRDFTPQEYRRFFEQALLIQGYALIPLEGLEGESFQLIDLYAVPQNRSMLAQRASYVPAGDLKQYDGRALLLTTVFELKYQDAQRVQASLRQYINDQQIERVFNQGNSTIVAMGFPHTLLQYAEVLRLADVAPSKELQRLAETGSLPERVSLLEQKVYSLENKLQALQKQ